MWQHYSTVLTRIVGHPNLGTQALIRVFLNRKSQLNLKSLSKIWFKLRNLYKIIKKKLKKNILKYKNNDFLWNISDYKYPKHAKLKKVICKIMQKRKIDE